MASKELSYLLLENSLLILILARHSWENILLFVEIRFITHCGFFLYIILCVSLAN